MQLLKDTFFLIALISLWLLVACSSDGPDPVEEIRVPQIADGSNTIYMKWTHGDALITAEGLAIRSLDSRTGNYTTLYDGESYHFTQSMEGRSLYIFNSLVIAGDTASLLRTELPSDNFELIEDSVYLAGEGIVVSSDETLVAVNLWEGDQSAVNPEIFVIDRTGNSRSQTGLVGVPLHFVDNQHLFCLLLTSEFVVYDLETQNTEPITLPGQILTYSTTDSHLAGTMRFEAGLARFHAVDLRNGESELLHSEPFTSSLATPYLPIFNKQLTEVAYWLSDGVVLQLIHIDLQTKEVEIIYQINPPFNAGPIEFSPDGSSLVFWENFQIYLATL